MSQHTLKLVLVAVSATCGIVLVLWLVVHRRRIDRALRNMEQLDIDGARTQLFTAQVNNSLEHQDQTDLLKAQAAALKTLDGRAQFLQADRIIEYERRLREQAAQPKDQPTGPAEDL